MADEVKIAATLYFDWVDQHGYPNGLMTWDELPDTSRSRHAADMQCKATWISLAESIGDITMARVEVRANSFLVIHEGDGRHAAVCGSHKEAAEAVIQGMWHGETAEILKEDEFASQLYDAILNPESDQWQDMDGKEIRYDFEDGSVTVIRIPVAFPALQAENEALREALKPMADAWHKLQSDGAPHLNADPEKPSHGMGTIKQKHTKRAAELLGAKPVSEGDPS